MAIGSKMSLSPGSQGPWDSSLEVPFAAGGDPFTKWLAMMGKNVCGLLTGYIGVYKLSMESFVLGRDVKGRLDL